jgi:hypothetical protein
MAAPSLLGKKFGRPPSALGGAAICGMASSPLSSFAGLGAPSTGGEGVGDGAIAWALADDEKFAVVAVTVVN